MWQPVLMIDGFILSILGLVMLIPAGYNFVIGQPVPTAFPTASALTVFIGLNLFLANLGNIEKITLRQGYLVTVISWISVCLFASLPFLLSDGFDFSSALFESVSGITGTGATILDDVESQSRPILLWRSLLNGLGGIGIVIFAVAMLPFLGIGGMQIFQRENADANDKFMPKFVDIAKWIIGVYLFLVIACAILLYLCGMNSFDAVNHALSAVATSGFSTKNASVSAFQSLPIEAVLTIFMILGSLPLTVYILLIRRQGIDTFRLGQVRYFLRHVLIFGFLTAVWLTFHNHISFAHALRLSFFNVVSIMTTTGMASCNYLDWGVGTTVFLMFLSLHGGCIGSTTGSVKVMRWQVMQAYLKKMTTSAVEPNRVIPVRTGDLPIEDGVVNSVFAYIMLFMLSIAFFALMLNLAGYDISSSIATAVAIITNTGPGVTKAIGPMGNFAFFSPSIRLFLCFGMLLGRLEIVTILVILTRSFWKN